ncbi:PKD-like family lipoprotein [Bacteroides pyogenes]|uniref:PKD-like family lipoprotein n=1 Tax=Bacteroides pyogenes TaxID=310300 RepID=UPI002A90D784|nr:PKD-like family lipoprotein [Bacteroides pyogenes]MDY5432785.1 PKD-like family lipoprotein [Bacteroides pyogenes]
MKKYISTTIVITLLAGALTSCINDESSLGGKEIPQLNIEGSGDVMPVYNFNLGETCTIEPQISYTGGDEKELKYVWSIGPYEEGVKGKMEEVGNEKVLTYKFLRGGSYYAHLIVTDGKVGQVANYRININRSFEQGYMIISKDAEGKGNLSFVKMLTPEEIAEGKEPVIIQHCLRQMNESISEDNLLNCALGSVTWPKSLTRVIVCMKDRCYFVDPNTLTIISAMKFTDVFAGFSADFFMPDSYSPYAYSKVMKKYVHLDLTYMFPYEYGYYKGYPFEDFYRCKYSSWGRIQNMTLFVDYTEGKVAKFNAYGGNNYFPSTGDLLKEKTIISTFLGTEMNPANYVTPVYILAQNDTHILLYKNDQSTKMDASHFISQQIEKSDQWAVPLQGTRFESSPKYYRYFYYIGNRIYVFLAESSFKLPEKERYAIDFGENEEITFINTDASREKLFVGTFDKLSRKGNFYIFNNADVSPDKQGSIYPEEVYKGCAERIVNIIYKPRI